jgi:hypothetical protein
MTIKSKAHLQALKELIEVITLAALLALTTDFCWALRDIYVNGLTIGMFFIASGLCVATVVTTIALSKYHQQQVKAFIKEHLALKLKNLKRKSKRSK